jgi:hypothetical protein
MSATHVDKRLDGLRQEGQQLPCPLLARVVRSQQRLPGHKGGVVRMCEDLDDSDAPTDLDTERLRLPGQSSRP